MSPEVKITHIPYMNKHTNILNLIKTLVKRGASNYAKIYSTFISSSRIKKNKVKLSFWKNQCLLPPNLRMQPVETRRRCN